MPHPWSKPKPAPAPPAPKPPTCKQCRAELEKRRRLLRDKLAGMPPAPF